MKIIVNEDEMYEINIPEQIDLVKFNEILSRLSTLAKVLGKTDERISANNGKVIVTRNKSCKDKWNLLKDNRDLFVELCKVYYGGDFEEYDKYIKEKGYFMIQNRTRFTSLPMKNLMEKHNIKPNEVGLLRFPLKGETYRELRLTQLKLMQEVNSKNEKSNDKSN